MLLNPPPPPPPEDAPQTSFAALSKLGRTPSRYRAKRRPPPHTTPTTPALPQDQDQPPKQPIQDDTPPIPAHVEPISLGYRKIYHKDSAASQEAVYGTTISRESPASSSSPPSKPRPKHAPSTVFNPLNPFLASLQDQPAHEDHHKPSPAANLQEKIALSKKHLEAVSRSLHVAKPTTAPTLDEIHASHAQKASAPKAAFKLHCPLLASTNFVESLLLDQTLSSVLKSLVPSLALPSSDPDDYMLWEVCPSLGLRRPLRSAELLRFIYESWPTVTSNFLQLDSSDARLDMSSLAFLTPRRDVLQAGPSGPSFYAKMHYNVGPKSWKKCYLSIANHGLIISRKSGPIDHVAARDKRVISHLSEFDVYEVSAGAKAPARYTIAIRSQQRADIFVDKKDSLHIFATDNAQDYAVFRNIVFTFRSQACDKAAKAQLKESKGSCPSSGASTPARIDSRTPLPGTTSTDHNPFRDTNSSQNSLSPSTTISSSSSSSSSSSFDRKHPPYHETLLDQQRKLTQAAQASAPLFVSHHNHPTLIDSIGPQNNPYIPETTQPLTRHDQPGPVMFQPDSLLGQMSHGGPPPSVEAVAAANGVSRHNTTSKSSSRSPFKHTLSSRS